MLVMEAHAAIHDVCFLFIDLPFDSIDVEFRVATYVRLRHSNFSNYLMTEITST